MQPDLFEQFVERGQQAQAAVDRELAAGRQAERRTASRHGAEIQALVPLALLLVDRAADHTVTATELRAAAVERNLLPAHGTGRQLSWLGQVFRAAGLVTTGERRRHGTAGTHGKWVAVWARP